MPTRRFWLIFSICLLWGIALSTGLFLIGMQVIHALNKALS